MILYSRKSKIANPYIVGAFLDVIYITTFYIGESETIYDLKVRREIL